MPNEYRLISDVETKELSIVPWGSVNRSFIIVKGSEKTGNENAFWEIKKGDNMPEKTQLEKEADMKTQLEKIEKEKQAETEKLKIEKEAKIKLEKEMSELKDSLKIAKEAAEKATAIAKEEKDIRLQSEKIAFAKENLSQLGGENELGKLLKEASEVLKKESYEFLLTTLKAAEEKIKSGNLFTELGKDTTKSANAKNSIDALAKEIVAKENVTYDVAVDRVINLHPEMLDSYYNNK